MIQTLVHNPDGSLTANDPFLTPGIRIRYLGSGAEYRYATLTQEAIDYRFEYVNKADVSLPKDLKERRKNMIWANWSSGTRLTHVMRDRVEVVDQ